MNRLSYKADRKELVWEEFPQEMQMYGGRSLIVKLMLDEVNPQCDPLGPENKFICCNGLLNNTAFTTSSRLSIGGKSPLTGGIKEANSGGIAAGMMGSLGIKAIVLEGKPADESWYIIKITDNDAELIEADSYMGLNNYALTEKLMEDFGDKIAVISIGIAGERQYLNSSVQITDLDKYPARAAARGGMGAVMGSKHIKAIVLKQDKVKVPASYYDKDTFLKANREYIQLLRNVPTVKDVLPYLGTASLVRICNTMGWMPVKNYSDGRWDKAGNVSGEKMAEMINERGGKTGHACQRGCVIKCSNEYVDPAGNHVTSALEYETIALCGPNCEIDDLDFIAWMDRQCDDLGLDTMELGCTLAVCMEAGIIGWGDQEAVRGLFKELQEGTELGRVLGNGTYYAGTHFGVSRIPTVKKQSMAGYDPRGLKGTGITYAISPMGADHTAGNAPTRNMDPNSYENEGKVKVSNTMQVIFALFDLMGACIFASSCAGNPDSWPLLADIMKGKFGGDWDRGKLFALATECLGMEKEFNRLAGFTQKDDRLPEFMYTEGLPSVDNRVFDIPDEDVQSALPYGMDI